LLKSIGTCEGQINEELMDVVTALSGSGPAYMFIVLDALADGGVKMGLTRQLALRLAVQTMLGSARMVIDELDNHPASKHIMKMKEEVCSPGGSTIAGVTELESHSIRAAFIRCIEKATIRSQELNNA
jgi:pyrroline-5-carboxylate reductase